MRERRQLKIYAIAVGTAALAAFASTTAAAAAERVTLEVERSYDPGCYCYRLRFRGVISPRMPNEYVAVTQRKCGFDFATSVAGASTPGRLLGGEVVRRRHEQRHVSGPVGSPPE